MDVALQVIGLGAPDDWTGSMGMEKKGSRIHDKPQVAEIRNMSGSWSFQAPGVDFRNSGCCVLALWEFHFLYSFSPKNNSGSCTEGAPGVWLGGGMVIFSWRS